MTSSPSASFTFESRNCHSAGGVSAPVETVIVACPNLARSVMLPVCVGVQPHTNAMLDLSNRPSATPSPVHGAFLTAEFPLSVRFYAVGGVSGCRSESEGVTGGYGVSGSG